LKEDDEMQTPGNEMWEQLWLPGGRSGKNALTPPVDGSIGHMILEQLKWVPDIRTELVVFLRRAIEENRYYVPDELVAESIISRCLARS
jgi:hypothetical protein